MKSIVWGNYKGGVGKTTSVFQVAAQFAKREKKVLLIDLDPQCSLSHICSRCNGINLGDVRVNETLNYFIELYMRFATADRQFDFNLMSDRLPASIIGDLLKNGIVKLQRSEFNSNLFFIPSSLSFENCRINELAQRMVKHIFNLFIIYLLIHDINGNENNFDYVFFDCPPTTNLLIQSAFLASDYYIVPTIIDGISAQGVADYITEIEKTASTYNMHENIGAIMLQKIFGSEKIKLLGVFETIYKERRGNADNSDKVATLDSNISDIHKDISVLSAAAYSDLRYNATIDGFGTQHIFKDYIGHRDNNSGGESIPTNTENGIPTPSYEELSANILRILEDIK